MAGENQNPRPPQNQSGAQRTRFKSKAVAPGWLTITTTPPPVFVSVAAKGLSISGSLLESTLVGDHVSVASKEVAGSKTVQKAFVS